MRFSAASPLLLRVTLCATRAMSEEEEYDVDRLLSKRVQGGVTQYEVRWTGFEETTWEPA